MSAHNFVVIDCETTGFGKSDRIVEIAAIVLAADTFETIDEYDTLLNPQRDIGPVRVHGITPSMVEAAPTFEEIASALSNRLHNVVLISHNLPFDVRMLSYEFQRLGISFDAGNGFCTYRASKEKLPAACRRFEIPLDIQHRALADARATAQLAKKLRIDNEAKLRAAKVKPLDSRAVNLRTLRREASDAELNEMSRIVSLAYYPSSDEKLHQYLTALDCVLDDNYIDNQERAHINELAATLGISEEVRQEAHRSYLASIIAAVKRDGIITISEKQLIDQIATALDVEDVTIPDVSKLPVIGNLREGMRVCFTGQEISKGVKISRSELEKLTAQAGMQPVSSVTQKGCDLLVAADISSNSGKARKARLYNIAVMGMRDFLKEIGFDDDRLV